MNGYLWTRLSRQMRYLSVQRGLDMVGRSQTKQKVNITTFPFLPPLSLPKRMLQLLMKCNTVLYLNATYNAYLKRNIFTRQVKEKCVPGVEEHELLCIKKLKYRGINPRLTENNTSLETLWYLNWDHPMEIKISCIVFLALKHVITPKLSHLSN